MTAQPSSILAADDFGAAMRTIVESRCDLTRRQASAMVRAMLELRLDEVQTAALLAALAQKGEAPDEIAGAVDAIATRHPPLSLGVQRALNIGGTGGDRSGTFNISTTASFVVASAGVPVVKHGNRRVTSDSGSSDMVAALGVDVARCSQEKRIRASLAACNFAFVSTASYYDFPAALTAVRRRIGIRSIFNLAGPLVHPAGVRFQVIGVAHPALLDLMADALLRLQGVTAFVVHGAGGVDEVSCVGETQIRWVRDGAVQSLAVQPADFGVQPCELHALRGGDPACNARICEAVLRGERGAFRDATVVAASAALVLAGQASSFQEAAEVSCRMLDTGSAFQVLKRFKEAMHENARENLRHNPS